MENFFGRELPTWPFFKLNMDGARKSSGVTSVGGLIRNSLGEWIEGFGMNIEICSITMAELWELYQGPSLAWNKGIRMLQIEVDNLCVT